MRCLMTILFALCFAPTAGAIDLVEAHRSALENDAAFAAQVSAAQAGREYAVQSRAALMPRVEITGQLARRSMGVNTGQSDQPSSLISTSDSYGDVYGYGVSFKQPLYRPDAVADARNLSAQADIAALNFRAAQQDLILRVSQVYFGVLLAQDTLAFAQAQKAAIAEQLAGAKARFDSGRARVTDVAEAQASFDSLHAAQIAAESELEISRARFFTLTGRPGEDPDPISLTGFSAPSEDFQTWLERARTDSIELRVRRLEVTMAEADVEKTRLAGRMSVDVVAQYEDMHQSGELSPLAAPDQSSGMTVGLQFSMPVFSSGALESRHRQATAKHRQARQQLEATRRDVDVDVREAYTRVTSGALRVAALEQGLASAQTSLEAGELGREVGNRTNLDVLTLQQQVFDVKRSLADARYTHLLTKLQLAAIVGQLTEQELRSLRNVAIARL